MIPKLTLFTTDGCHLCEKALENIRLAQSLLPFQIEMIDIQDEYNTFQKHKDDIPVILVNGLETMVSINVVIFGGFVFSYLRLEKR